MYYQIRLPLVCLLILINCYWYYSRKKRLHTRTSNAFSLMSGVSIVHLTAAVVTEYTVNNRDKVSYAFNYIWHIIFLVSLTCACGLILYYLILYIERGTGRQRKIEKRILWTVCACGIFAQMILPIEYIDTPDGSYSLGMKAYSLYVVVVYVLVMMLINLIRYRNIIEKEKSSVLIASVIIFIVISLIQIYRPYMLLTGPALTLIILGIMVNTEDAHLYVSYKTGLYNEIGCQEIIQERVLAGKPFKVGVYVFVGDDMEIERAMVSLDKKLTDKKGGLMCGTMRDNVLIVLPLIRVTGSHQFPEKLPYPEVKKGELKSEIRILNFEGTESAKQIEDTIQDCKNRYEESVLHKDELTGLLRREAYIRQVDHLISRQIAFSMLMIDLDNFKTANDSYGHGMGDEVLKYTAQVFRHVVRSSDIICRMGGDEFSIILCEVTDKERIREIVGRAMERLLQADFLPDDRYKIRISVGVVIHRPENGIPSFQELYAEADSALYRTKYHGKNGISFVEI